MKRQYITALLVAAAVLPTQAQQLSQDITIDRDINPTLRAATRLNLYPEVLQPEVEQSQLSFSDMTTSAQVPGMLTHLQPASPASAIAKSPYRGYASLGYFPVFNLGASAGYHFIQQPGRMLGAWLQYDGNSYDDTDETLTRHSGTVGVDFTNFFRGNGRLDVSADYTYHWLNRPWLSADPDYHVNDVDVEILWSTRRREMAWYLSGGYDYFGMSGRERSMTPATDIADGLKQNVIKLKGGTAYFITDKSSMAGHAEFDLVTFNHFNTITPDEGLVGGGSKVIGLVTLDPSYRYHSRVFRANIGVNLQLATNDGTAFHIAPDLTFTVKPVIWLSATVKAGGGKHVNRLSELFDINPYMSPSQAFGFSKLPITADAEILFGPFRGVAINLYGGYAKATNWLMPEQINSNCTAFTPSNLTAWHCGASIDWKFADLLTANASYEYSPNSLEHTYYTHADRARHIVKAEVKVTPIERLDVGASFEMRIYRVIYSGTTPIDLGDSNSLNLGARYSISEPFTVFARVENILNNRSRMLIDRRSQGVKGLIGVSFKF